MMKIWNIVLKTLILLGFLVVFNTCFYWSLTDRYEVSGKCKTEYARENNIPEATFRTWVKEATYANFKNPNFIRVFS